MNGRGFTRNSCTRYHAVLIVLCLLMAGCAGRQPWSLEGRILEDDDRRPLAVEPRERDPSLYWDAFHQSTFYLIKNSLDLSRQIRKGVDAQQRSNNNDFFGGVPNSSWFTNRHGTRRMSREELRRGPNTIAGPDPNGPWTITRAKTQGVTPGFFVRDSQGETFIIKFDPQDHPELATGAEMICTKFFHACGYNVPENYLVTFDPTILKIKEGLEFRDREGHRQPFTQQVLDNILSDVARHTDGTIRVVASRFLPGKPLGPFSYKGRRGDDPNDYLRHQHRRDLRGLKLFAQLVNHFDTKDHNSLDMLVDDGDGPYIRHYLIDFGSTLGSDGDEPKAPYKGYAYVIDLEQIAVSLVTLGLRRWSWEGASAEGIPSAVGYFESDRFTPPGWKPLHANPAFDNLTAQDAYWAARIVAAFTEDDLRACVEAGEYSDPAATEYLVTTLMARRRKIIDYYYAKLNPLDEFTLVASEAGLTLEFVDRWVTDRVGPVDQVRHRYRFGHGRKSWGRYQDMPVAGVITWDAEATSQMAKIIGEAQDDRDRVFSVQIQSRRGGRWGHWVRAYFYYDGDPAGAYLVGVEHAS